MTDPGPLDWSVDPTSRTEYRCRACLGEVYLGEWTFCIDCGRGEETAKDIPDEPPVPPCCGAPQLGPVPGIGYYCHLGWKCSAPSIFAPPAPSVYDVMRNHGIVNRIVQVEGEEDRYETDAEALDRHLTGTP